MVALSANRSYLLLCSATGVVFAALMVYSQTIAFSWDEGFHLLAATLIHQGKRPYLDFCFPQTPLNAYLNAAWMSLVGDSWRSAHVLATIFTTAAILLTGDLVFRRFPVAEWKLPAAIFCVILMCSVFAVIAFAPIAQAYAICMLLTVAAVRLSMAAARRPSVRMVFAAGLCAGASAACSMLTAATVPVILAWCVIENRARRWKAAALFLIAATIPFAPVLHLFSEGPRQVWFNIVQYQTVYRRTNWTDTGAHDLEVFFGLVESPAAMLLVLLGAAGIVYAFKEDLWDHTLRRELCYCAAIAFAISAELWTAHPTFERYFLLTVPFLAIPAAAGMFFVTARLYRADRPWPAIGLAAVLTLLGLADRLFDDRDSFKWRDMEAVAAKVSEVTPAGAPLLADELTYFLTRRPVPDGMEFAYSHELDLPAALSRELHIIPQAKLDEMVGHETFATVESCSDDDIKRWKLDALYSAEAAVGNCHVFWHPN